MKRTKQYLAALIAILTYYCVHEGAHLFYALSMPSYNILFHNSMGFRMQNRKMHPEIPRSAGHVP